MFNYKVKYFILFTLALTFREGFCAGFNIGATRIVYPENAKSVTISPSNNTTDTVFLVAAKVGTDKSGESSSPFKVTPPLFRMEPGTTNRVKIINTGGNLPRDRETLFYFIASAIPSSSSADKDNEENITGRMSLALKMIIKFFYRPEGLNSTPATAAENLQFKRLENGINVKNDSPYYVSFSHIDVDGKKVEFITKSSQMISPFSQQSYQGNFKNGKVKWGVINDLGGVDNYAGETK